MPPGIKKGHIFAALEDRFLDKISVGYENGCWEWQGAKSVGYGKIMTQAQPIPVLVGAHRISYELFRGKIPDGLYIDHLCRNRACVNPSHMETVTNRENIRRTPRIAQRAKEMTCAHGHDLKEWGVLRVDPRTTDPESGYYRCKLCSRENALAYHYKNRDERVALMASRRRKRGIKPRGSYTTKATRT